MTTKKKKTIMFVIGTRPDALKMLPLYKEFKQHEEFDVKLCSTGQHKQLLNAPLELFDVKPDFDLDIMRSQQTLTELTSGILKKMQPLLQSTKPDWLMVHGDTTSGTSAALSGFYHKVKIAHVEAGLRTYNRMSPWPEEMNRNLITKLADVHFCPTHETKLNLVKEGITTKNIHVVGNSIIDTLIYALTLISQQKHLELRLSQKFPYLREGKIALLATIHRRENFGKPLLDICAALATLARTLDCVIVIPVHKNPNVSEMLFNILSDISGIHLVDPLEYLEMVFVMQRVNLILTDSGGIQEEAPTLGKHILVLRESTERPEIVEVGAATLVGSSTDKIITTVKKLMNKKNDSRRSVTNPFGDGNTSSYIANIMKGLPDAER